MFVARLWDRRCQLSGVRDVFAGGLDAVIYEPPSCYRPAKHDHVYLISICLSVSMLRYWHQCKVYFSFEGAQRGAGPHNNSRGKSWR